MIRRGETPTTGPGDYVFTRAALRSVSAFDPSIKYARDALADFGLDDWDWLAHDLAETMDDAALSAADTWLADYRSQLANAAQYPRWCPCGRWPDFGTGCPYHGPCTCIGKSDDWSTRGEPRIVAIIRWNGDNRYIGPGCPVHPEGWMPQDALDVHRAAKRGRDWEFSTTIFGPRGRTP